MHRKILLAFTLVALATAMPAIQVRDDPDAITTNSSTGAVNSDDTPNYLNPDGTTDLTALIAAAATPATDLDAIPLIPANITVPIDLSNLTSTAVDEALAQATGDGSDDGEDSTTKRSNSLTQLLKRDSPHPGDSGDGGTWTDYPTCTNAQHPKVKSSSPAYIQGVTYAQFTPNQNQFKTVSTQAEPPVGFLPAYTNLAGSFQPSNVGNAFLGIMAPATYNVAACAKYCQKNLAGQCAGFNVGVEWSLAFMSSLRVMLTSLLL